MKIFNLLFGILFVVSAALQYNDPDPWLWIPIYLYGALICFMALRGRYPVNAMLFGIGVYMLYAIYLFFTDDGVVDWISEHEAENIAGSMKASKPWIEDTREFFGLCILSFVLLINYLSAKRGLKHKTV